MEVKDILRNKRIELGLTMKQLAEKVGVSEGTISRWESGEIANMKRDKIVLLANALGIAPAVIMGWSQADPEPEPEQYYLNDDARDLAEFLFHHPEHKVLFDAARGVRKEDMELVLQLIERFSDHDA